MKNKTIILFIISLMLFSSCSLNQKDKDPTTALYEKLNLYMIKANAKCSAFVDLKQIDSQIIDKADKFGFFLTKTGKVYEFNLEGKLYSATNENCVEKQILKGKKVDLFVSDIYFLIDNDFYTIINDMEEVLEISYVDSNTRLKNDLAKYGPRKFQYGSRGSIFTINNVLSSSMNWQDYTEDVIIGLEQGENILELFDWSFKTNKAIYTFQYQINKSECEKYSDIKCVNGFVRDVKRTEILVELKDITIYFDGTVLIDKKGVFYYFQEGY